MSAYVGSSKNLKDLKDLHMPQQGLLRLRPEMMRGKDVFAQVTTQGTRKPRGGSMEYQAGLLGGAILGKYPQMIDKVKWMDRRTPERERKREIATDSEREKETERAKARESERERNK